MSFGTRLAQALLVLVVVAAPVMAFADDKCESQCDDQADKCNQSAGQDKSKQKQCDSSYEECLAKCK
jgi:hypothetical protein